MAEEVHYSDSAAKRKYDDSTTPPPPSSGRRNTGFSAPIIPDSAPPYNSVPPPVDEIQLAKQKAQEIAARLFNNAEAKRPKFENGGAFDSNDGLPHKPMLTTAPSIPSSYGYGNPSKKIEIPNGRVGVIIGKGGETIKYLQLQSGAKIQITRDMDADPHSLTRAVELTGSSESIAKAEQLIKDVLAEAESGGSGRSTGYPGGTEQFVMKVPNNKVGLIIGKGGETIKNMQASTGARIQVIPLHLPPGDTSTERTVQIDGSSEQIEAVKQLVNEVISENRQRNPMGGGYSQQGYQVRPQTSWAPPAPQLQQQGYGYMQPGVYSGQYNTQPQYAGYSSQQTSGGYASGWDQSASAQQGGAYDYYNQQAPPTQAPSGPTDTSAYGYNQQGQTYAQDAYSGGYDQPQPGGTDGQTASSYGAQGDSANQAPPPPASSYGQQPTPNLSYPQASTQPGYGVPPTSQPVYGAQAPSYGGSYGQKPPAGQQQSPTAAAQGGYAQPAPYPAAAGGYAQPDAPPSGYATPGYSQAPPATPLGYGGQQAQTYGSSYGSGYPHQAPAAQPSGGVVPKASPQQS